MKTFEAWHFLHEREGKPITRDKRTVKAGTVLRVKLPLRLCVRGLHVSRHPLDALQYAPSAWVERVCVGGEVLEDPSKGCGSWRETHVREAAHPVAP